MLLVVSKAALLFVCGRAVVSWWDWFLRDVFLFALAWVVVALGFGGVCAWRFGFRGIGFSFSLFSFSSSSSLLSACCCCFGGLLSARCKLNS